jgi:hypothetical protein
VAETEHGIVWSSDKDHLDSALEASELKCLSKYQVDPEQVYFVRDGAFFYVKDLKIKLRTWKSSSYGHSSHSRGGYVQTPLGSTGEDTYWGINGVAWPPHRRSMETASTGTGTHLEKVEKKKDDPECSCCGSPLDNGVCLMQFSTDCDGWSATGIKDATKGGKRTDANVIDEIIYESWVVNDGDEKGILEAVEHIKAARKELCAGCKDSVPMAGDAHCDWLATSTGGAATSYFGCVGPRDGILETYVAVTKLFPRCSTKLNYLAGAWSVRIMFHDAPDKFVTSIQQATAVAESWRRAAEDKPRIVATLPETAQGKTDSAPAAVVGAGPLDKGEHVAV